MSTEIQSGLMSRVMTGRGAQEAWDEFHRMTLDDAQMRDIIRALAETEVGREILDESRATWRGRGFATAPFDFLFK